MARRLEMTVSAAVKTACGKLAEKFGIELGVAVILPEGPLAAEAEGPIAATLIAEGLTVIHIARLEADATEDEPAVIGRTMLLVTE